MIIILFYGGRRKTMPLYAAHNRVHAHGRSRTHTSSGSGYFDVAAHFTCFSFFLFSCRTGKKKKKPSALKSLSCYFVKFKRDRFSTCLAAGPGQKTCARSRVFILPGDNTRNVVWSRFVLFKFVHAKTHKACIVRARV